jgi:predicted ATPase
VSRLYRESDNGIPAVVCKLAEELKASLSKQSRRASIISSPKEDAPKSSLFEIEALGLKPKIVLKVAAVCGMKFTYDLISLVLQRMNYNDVSSELLTFFDVIKSHHLIRTTQSPPPYMASEVSKSQASRRYVTYCFLDKEVVSSVYATLLEGHREFMHRSIADAVEEQYETSPELFTPQVVMFLAYHYARSGRASDAKKITYLERSGQYSLKFPKSTDSQTYFEQLIMLSLNNSSSHDIMQHHLSNSSKNRPGGNIKIQLLQTYLTEGDISGRVRSQHRLISNSQLMFYFLSLSVLEFRCITSSINLFYF